jgi:hypothetical protein
MDASFPAWMPEYLRPVAAGAGLIQVRAEDLG